jgi:hypothetical protein
MFDTPVPSVLDIEKLKVKGRFIAEVTRKNGTVEKHELFNAVTNEGKNKLFDVMFDSATQITTWYIGLMDNASYSASPVTDTMSSHAGWLEFDDYSESVRQTWDAGPAASQAISNASPATFNINASGTLRGIFVNSVSTKNGTTGTLWATALFSSTLAVSNGDQIKITYTVSA